MVCYVDCFGATFQDPFCCLPFQVACTTSGPFRLCTDSLPLAGSLQTEPVREDAPILVQREEEEIPQQKGFAHYGHGSQLLHSGGDFSELKWIGRPQTSAHRSIYGRLKALLLSDVLTPDFSMVWAGRKFPQLLARLSEVSDYVTQHGVASQPYTKTFEGVELQRQQDLLPGLEPYKKADPSRFRLSGRGHWDVTDFLPDGLCMA